MSIDIYQINYSSNVRVPLDKDFHLYDCTNTPAWEKREIFHMYRFYSEDRHTNSDYCGLVSPKFNAKTKIAGRQFVEFIERHPGYDVYFINPFPQMTYLSFNVWEQGAFWHHKLYDLANVALAAAGYEVDVSQLPRNKADTLLYSNYWVGNHSFWDQYMTFIRRLMDSIDNLPSAKRSEFFNIAPHASSATYYPFVFERIFSTFLLMESGVKFLAYPWSRAEVIGHCETQMEALLVREWADMIDEWDVSGTYTPDQRRIFASLMKIAQLYRAQQSRKRRTGEFRKLLDALVKCFGTSSISQGRQGGR